MRKANRILPSVDKKQKTTKDVSQEDIKSVVAKSLNNSVGSAMVNTNLLAFPIKASSKRCSFRNKRPKSISEKTGTVAFKQNSKLFIITSF